MSHTRAALDRKLTLLEERARELTPRRYAERHMPDYMAERAIGALLTIVGLRMAWGMAKKRRQRKLREQMIRYGRW